MELPAGIRQRHFTGVNGLAVHVLEAGFDTSKRPAIHRNRRLPTRERMPA